MLCEVARRLLSCVRSYDFVGRYGGEEFLMVLNNCSEDKALDRGEEVRRIIAASPIKTSAGPLSVTVSVGALASRQWESCQPEDLFREADNAMYAAKAAGRNCCRMATPVEAGVF